MDISGSITINSNKIMTEEAYFNQRHKLVEEVMFLRQRHCNLSARARIRKIADLDFEQRGIDRSVTYKNFNY